MQVQVKARLAARLTVDIRDVELPNELSKRRLHKGVTIGRGIVQCLRNCIGAPRRTLRVAMVRSVKQSICHA